MSYATALFEHKKRICPCCTLQPSLSRTVHIVCPCRIILCSLSRDKPRNAIYPRMPQVAVPSAFGRWQHMVCRTILYSLSTDTSCGAIYPRIPQVAVPSSFNRCQHMVCSQRKSANLCDKNTNIIYTY